jgi:hypothetical protein
MGELGLARRRWPRHSHQVLGSILQENQRCERRCMACIEGKVGELEGVYKRLVAFEFRLIHRCT